MSVPRELNDFQASESLGPAFVGLQLFQLLALIDHQGAELLDNRGMEIPSRSGSTLAFLLREEQASVSQLAAFLGMSHQLASHRVKDLQRRGLLEQAPDPQDARRKVLRLTGTGRVLARKMIRLGDALELVFQDLFNEIGTDLFEALVRAKAALARRGLADRLAST